MGYIRIAGRDDEVIVSEFLPLFEGPHFETAINLTTDGPGQSTYRRTQLGLVFFSYHYLLR